MKVRILRETNMVNHGLLEKGKVIESDNKNFTEKVLQRWVKRGIAVETQEKPKAQAPVNKTVNAVEDNSNYVTEEEVMKELYITEDELTDEPEISKMTFAELRRYAKENGYENYGKMNREELIEMLTEEEEAEEKSPFFDGNE